MEYVDALFRDGWTPDPADRVEVVALHAASCPLREGRRCLCRPRLTLRPVPLRRDALHDDRFEEDLEIRATG